MLHAPKAALVPCEDTPPKGKIAPKEGQAYVPYD